MRRHPPGLKDSPEWCFQVSVDPGSQDWTVVDNRDWLPDAARENCWNYACGYCRVRWLGIALNEYGAAEWAKRHEGTCAARLAPPKPKRKRARVKP
jgi:hypothetical protein